MYLDGSVNIDVNKLSDQVSQIMAKLGPIAQHVWEVYVRQQYVEGFQNVFAAVVLLGIAIALGIVVKVKLWSWAKNYDYGYHSESEGTAYLAPGAVLAIAAFMFILGVLNVSWAIGHFVNPEYGAIQDLLGH